VHLNAAGQVELKLKTTWRDGTTLLVMSPLESTQQLAALVPRPVAKNSPANDCFAAVNRGTRMPAVGRLPPTILHRSTVGLGQIADLDRVPAECSFDGREATFERV